MAHGRGNNKRGVHLSRLRRKPHKQPYLPPGSLVQTGEAPARPVALELIRYDADSYSEHKLDEAAGELHPEQLARLIDPRSKSGVQWLNSEGLSAEAVAAFGTCCGLHPLVQEDILHTAQRPKVDDYDDYLYIVLHMISVDPSLHTLDTEQVSLVLGRGWLLTFQEGKHGDCLEVVRERLRKARGKIRRLGADYLAYALIDSIVDHHFEVLERLGDWIEDLEEEAVAAPSQTTMQRIYALRREMLLLRKSVWPLRDVINTLVRNESPVLQSENRLFFRDVYDHSVQVIETMETYREMLGSMLEVYLSSLSNRMNEIMKVLTVISTLFIPLTFVVGVYGMNFNTQASPWNMPELNWYLGYPLCLVLMLAMSIGQLMFFYRKGWIGHREAAPHVPPDDEHR